MRLTAPASAGRLPAPAIWPRQSCGPLCIKRGGLCQRPLRLVIDVERFEQGGLIHHRLAADASTGARETVAIENIQIAVLRSEERRGVKEWVSKCRSGWLPDP